MIELKNISKTYKSKKGATTEALNNINLKFNETGLVFVVGKSGSGKSTLLNLLGGLDSPDKGQIIVDNKDICVFNNKELDSYRNSYVGFIFQEFNILEEFNVFDNVRLSLELQNKINDKSVENVLKQVDLSNLKNRNINELSGGQKQRVSIARAIVKKPKLILADEPTGNLDRKSSEMIFDILKTISKDQLVVVVSHDIESAEKYADRIIRIEDGKIVNDTNELKNSKSDNNLDLIVSKLPFKYAFKMAYSYIMNNPFRLVMVILLSMIALSFMSFAINMYVFDNNKFLVNNMKENNLNVINVNKILYMVNNDTRIDRELDIDDSSIEYIENVTSSKANESYVLYEDGISLSFTFGNLDSSLTDNNAYNVKPSGFKYIKLNDTRIIPNILGNYPVNDNEIVVHKYFADSIINYGILIDDGSMFKPTSYEEIINSRRGIKLNNHSVIISGIVDDDNEIFKRSFISGEFWSTDFENYYKETYSGLSSLIYVNESFINNINLSNNVNTKTLEIDNIDSSIKILNKEISYIDLNGNINNISNINNDEVILSIEDLKQLDLDSNRDLENYIKSNSTKVYNNILEEFLMLYSKNNKVKTIKLIDRSNNIIKTSELKVVGFTISDNSYISSSYISMNNSNQKVESVYVYCDNSVLSYVFDKFTIRYSYNYFVPGEMYIVKYSNSDRASGIIYSYRYIKRYLLSLSLVFICFAFLLTLTFISDSITNVRKQIGILRAIGTRSLDVIKIFEIESLLIGIISWGFGILIWLIECKVLNNSIFGNNYYILNGIFVNPVVLPITLVFNVVISFLITLSLIDKINKVKPIDVILNKM